MPRAQDAQPEKPEQKFKPGDRQDFDRLYRETYPRVRFTLLAMLRNPSDAEDCAQEAYANAFPAWKHFKNDAPAEAWIHRIAINTAISYRRREKLREVGETIRRIGRPQEHTDSGAAIELMDALRKLPPKQAAVIVLRHHHGYTNRDIAKALNMPESTIASRLADAKKKLQAILGPSAPVTEAEPGAETKLNQSGAQAEPEW